MSKIKEVTILERQQELAMLCCITILVWHHCDTRSHTLIILLGIIATVRHINGGVIVSQGHGVTKAVTGEVVIDALCVCFSNSCKYLYFTIFVYMHSSIRLDQIPASFPRNLNMAARLNSFRILSLSWFNDISMFCNHLNSYY